MTATAHRSPRPAVPELMEQAAGLLRSTGSRRTPGRVAMVAALLEASPRHLTAGKLDAWLHEAGWRADTSGIHRAMVTVTDLGLVHILPAPGPVAYGLSHPAHHHALCTHCGAIIELAISELAAASTAAETALAAIDAAGGIPGDPGVGSVSPGRSRAAGPLRPLRPNRSRPGVTAVSTDSAEELPWPSNPGDDHVAAAAE